MARLSATHTFAELDVSAAAYDEIAGKLREAGYDQCFMPDGAIDMHGIGLVKKAEAVPMPPESVPLSPQERSVLEWIGKEDTSAYGECRGPALDGLIVRGLAEITEQSRTSDPAKKDYQRVRVTLEGQLVLQRGSN